MTTSKPTNSEQQTLAKDHKEIPGLVDLPCECLPVQDRTDGSTYCICGPTEKMLRHWSDGYGAPMTPEQRAWCKAEVEAVECGDWPGDDADTQQVASAVLDAWRTYCRDKGLY